MNNFKKKLLLYLSITALFINSQHAYSIKNSSISSITPSEQLNIRISKDNYSDFHESLILNLNDKFFKMNQLYYSGFNLNTGSFSYFDLINKKTSFKSNLSDDRNFSPRETENTNIYNINIAKSKITDESISNPLNINHINISSYKHLNVVQLTEKFDQAFKNKQMHEARFYLDLAMSLKGNTSWNFAEIANKYEKLNLSNKAECAWKTALSLSNNRIELIYTYSLYLIRTEQPDKACLYLNKIIKLNPKFMLAYYNLGNIYFQKNQYINAIKSYYNAVSINPYSEDSYYNLALSLETINQKHLAAIYYKECIRLNPNDKQAKAALKRVNI